MATEGQCDWVNVGALLKQHENSSDCYNNMVKWKDFALRLSKGNTIDSSEMTIMEGDKNNWRDVLTRLISIILFDREVYFTQGICKYIASGQ